MAVIAERGTSKTAVASVGEHLGTNRAGAEERLKLLESAHLVWRLYNADGSSRTAAHVDAAHPKLYVMDPLVLAAAGLDPSDHLPFLFEAMVGVHLGRALASQRVPFYENLLFDDPDSDGETDFLPRDDDAPAVEVKSGGGRDGVAALAGRHGRGIVATGNGFDVTGEVWRVPAAYLSYMLELQS